VGTFKLGFGDGPCYTCPAGASTTGPLYAEASSPSQCACLDGYYSVRNASGALQRCLPCPNGTFREPLQADDGVCHPCPPRMFTPGTGSAYCYCVPGTYPNSSTYDACVVCEPGFYCDGTTKAPCPEQSSTPSGAAARGECVCNPATHYGDLSRDGGVCLPRPPGYVCENATGTVGCACADGWTLSSSSSREAAPGVVRCRNPCVAGQYARLQPRSQVLAECATCPPDTYASDGGLVDACTPCPLGRGTQGLQGSTSAANCTCLLLPGEGGDDTAACGGCPAGAFFDPPARRCQPCPDGWTSQGNAVGRAACVCPRGAYALGRVCAPCPLHTFSRAMGLTCTPCPPGCTTEAVGQTSMAQCRCARGGRSAI
jgi:hypothetical protein